MASCPKCYTLLPYGATVCPSCGTNLAPLASSSPSAPTPPAPAAASTRTVSKVDATQEDLPASPTLPLFAGETILSRYANSPAGQAQVVRSNGLIVVGILAIFLIPFVA